MNNNPIRLIATCTVYLSDGEELSASVGIDVKYDATADAIHNQILRVVTESLSENGHEIVTAIVTNICNLGQVPMPEPVNTFSRINGIGMLPGVRECRVCGDDHGSSGLPCPKMTPYS